MKGYYLFAPMQEGNLIGAHSGVERKIRSQLAVFQRHFDMTLSLRTAKYGAVQKLCARLPFFSSMGRGLKYSGECDGCGFLYIRHRYIDSALIRYLRAVRRRNPNIKIVYEIPTYPYNTERKMDASNFYILLKDRANSKKLKNYVDRIVTFYNQDEIFGIRTIKLMNGFDFSSCKPSTETPDIRRQTDVIEVSITAFWHGYDRLIEGLHGYYSAGGKENIVFHMVGPVLPEHKALVEKYGLQSHVVFHGKLFGAELDSVYAPCVLGIDILGGHRKDYPVSSTLKSREFAARGLPLVTSSPVDYIGEGYPYQLIEPYDDSPIDIGGLLEFVRGCYRDKAVAEVRSEIRAYGEARIDMAKTMQPLISYLKGE